MFVCAYVCVMVCVHACVFACMHVCMCMCVCVRVCMHACVWIISTTSITHHHLHHHHHHHHTPCLCGMPPHTWAAAETQVHLHRWCGAVCPQRSTQTKLVGVAMWEGQVMSVPNTSVTVRCEYLCSYMLSSLSLPLHSIPFPPLTPPLAPPPAVQAPHGDRHRPTSLLLSCE